MQVTPKCRTIALNIIIHTENGQRMLTLRKCLPTHNPTQKHHINFARHS